MGLIAHIHIKFYTAQLPSILYTALHNGEWGFDETITHEHYEDSAEMGDWQYAPTDMLEQTFALLDQYHRSGDTVSVHFYWPDDRMYIDVAVDPQGDLTLFFDGSRPTLQGLRFTDYSSVLQRILPPLLDARCNINSVQCEDEI